ncbi:MAG TPA: zinc-binding alcohol dehydrogenase family protein [Acidimicrobiales bacterium]|nr:zinc-binding alcohol dehydrogenase family protein [Acidimicrobiales bacterium]HTW06993.1 zinc-binding alcohol dehydrogenase family protein [Acidimicrobiales bacterium]
MSMHAAVVRSFDHPPRYETFPTPRPAEPDEVIVDVLAAALHPRVRTDASGRHYTSTGALPMIPGIDGVGRLPDGQQIYFVVPDNMWGSMAEQAVADLRLTVPLAEDVNVAKVAAAMNPAMSAWVALRRRVPLQAGQSVLVLGATGNAGAMAVQVAKRLGAGAVIGAGRNPERLAALPSLGADQVVALADDPEVTGERLANAAAEVDVVVDYLWGKPASTAMMALLKARADRSRAMDWVQIGATAGPTIELPSVALRSANLRLQGNGQGAVPTAVYVGELPALVEEIDNGGIEVNAETVPLLDVEATWTAPAVPGVRTVFIP